jgi:hypothetical protein
MDELAKKQEYIIRQFIVVNALAPPSPARALEADIFPIIA